MFRERAPTWVLSGGFVLTAMAGCVNAVGILGLHHQPISHLTGTITQFGTDLVRGEQELAIRTGTLIGSFFIGALISAMILRHTGLRLGRRYGAVLVTQSVILVGAFLALNAGHLWGEYLAAGACGLQNAMATSYSGAVIRSTHMTGIVTDLAIALGQRLRGQDVDKYRVRLYLLLLSGFTLGSAVGTWGYITVGYKVILVPAALSGGAGLGYAVLKHWQRRKGVLTQPPFPST